MVSGKRGFKKNHGFTLIEALFSMAVILVGIVACFGLFQAALSSLTQARARTEAALLASNLLEEFKSFGYASLPGSGTVAGLAMAYPGRITTFPPPFEGDVEVSAVSEDLDLNGINDYQDKTGSSTLKSILVKVRALGVRFKEVSFRTRIAK